MQVICDVVITDLIRGVGKKSNKEYYQFKGVIVGCQELPVLAGVDFNKFVSKEVFEQIYTITEGGYDRFDCSIGLSRASVNQKDCDIGFNLFINGFPKEPEEEIEVEEPLKNVSPSPVPETSDKNKEKGGKS